jgi:hypothetical protein
MGGNQSSSSHTETHAGAKGADGMIFMGSSSLEKKAKGAVTLTVGKGGKDGGAPGEDTLIKLSDGTSLVSAFGGGKASGISNFDRKAHPDWGWNKYGLGADSDKPGGDGYGLMTIFTLKIAKKGTSTTTTTGPTGPTATV